METGKAVIANVEWEKFISLEVESALTPDVETIFKEGSFIKRKPSGIEGVHGSKELTGSVEVGTSSTIGGSRAVPERDDDFWSDIDLDEEWSFLERNTRVDIRTVGPNQHIIIPVDYDL